MNPSKYANESITQVAQSVARVFVSETRDSDTAGTASLSIWIKDDGALGVHFATRKRGGRGNDKPLPISEELVRSLSSLVTLRATQKDTWRQLRMEVSLDGSGQIEFETYFKHVPRGE